MKLIPRWLFLLGLLAICACEYTPTGLYEKDVSPQIDPAALQQLRIDLLSMSPHDTLHISRWTSFFYNISTGNLQLYRVVRKINGGTVGVDEGPIGEFIIDPSLMRTGFHTFSLEAYAQTGTGSLADKVGAEQVVFSRSWVFEVDNSPPHKINLLTIAPHEGQLKIEWEPYTRINFQNYTVIKTGVFRTESFRLWGQNEASFIDREFIGGSATYTVFVTTIRGEESPHSWQTFTDDIPRIQSVELLPDNKVKVSWNKCNYYRNFARYVITENYFDSFNPEGGVSRQGFGFAHVNDTVQIFENPPFGRRRQFKLITHDINELYSAAHTSSAQYDYEAPFARYFRSAYSPAKKQVYYTNMKTIYTWDEANETVLASRTLPVEQTILWLSAEEDGRYLIAWGQDRLFSLDPSSLAIQAELAIADLLGPNHTIQAAAVSPRGHLALIVLKPFSTYSLLVYDLVTGRVLSQQESPYGKGGPSELRFSRRGKYLYEYRGMHLLHQVGANGQLVTQAIPVSNAGTHVFMGAFSPDESQLYIVLNKTTIEAFRTSDLQLSKAHTFSDAQVLGISPVNGLFLRTQNKEPLGLSLTLFDFQTGQEGKTYRLDNEDLQLDLYETYLYSSGGTRLKVGL
jgi:hypothetical protein